jgi:RNA polymerase sigma-70 factor (ECF subfamily)
MERATELEALLGEQYPAALRLARTILREDEEAADAVQAAFSNVFKSYTNFREESSFSTWLNRIVVNQCLMRLRQMRRHPSVSMEALSVEPKQPLYPASRLPGPFEALQQTEAAAAIDRAVHGLPARLRDAWVLHEYEGLDLRGLSETLGISISAAKSRLFRARAELRRMLTQILGPRTALAS